MVLFRFSKCIRGDRIRTYDFLFPKQVRYLAALHPAEQSKFDGWQDQSTFHVDQSGWPC